MAGLLRFRLPYMGDVFRSYAALEELVAYLVPSRYVRKCDGKIPPAVVGEMRLAAFSSGQSRIYPPFPQVCKQDRGRKRHNFQLLETRLRRGLPGKREGDGAHVRCLPCYHFQKVGHMVGCVKFRRQCDDVAAFPGGKVVPEITFGVHLERGLGFLPQR